MSKLDPVKLPRGAVSLAMALLLAGCGHLPHVPTPHWPWHPRAAPAPQPVQELEIAPAANSTAAPFPQYWQRNTLVVDLRAANGQGSLVMRPRAGTTWPVRIALRVMPGSLGELEVRGAQRVLLPVTAQGTRPVDLELPPGSYRLRTPEITVAWGPAPQPQALSSGAAAPGPSAQASGPGIR